ncbi:glycosyltransferase family 9 protein [bacterium]|nr:glycosyltransferase family 9 protein [bacterium]
MNFRLAALLDKFVGRVLVQLITLLPPFPKQIPQNANFENILIIKFWGFGSILEATPFFHSLKQSYSDVALDILTFSDNKQIVESLGLFRNVHVMDSRKGILNFFKQTIRFILSYRQKYSLVIDMDFFAYFSALITKISGSIYSLGFKSFFPRRNRCYSCTVVFDHSSHIRMIFLKFLDALHIKNPEDISLLAPNVPEEKKLSVMEKFPELKDNRPKIAVNINAGNLFMGRRWPEENFRKLIGLIQQDCNNLQIYLVGGKEDLPVVISFYESLPDKRGVHVTAGKLDIMEFSYVLSKMDCLITSDSGPLHIAEAIGIPIVGFFGPETPNLYGPMSDRSLVFYKNLFCSPCLNTYNHKMSDCTNNQCLKLISAEDVYEKIKDRYF